MGPALLNLFRVPYEPRGNSPPRLGKGKCLHRPAILFTVTLLTLAGSDSGGGAGLQADLKTFGALGHRGAAAVSCVTAQNTRGVQRLESLSPALLREQVSSVREDLDVAAAKTGALPTPELVEAAAGAAGDLTLVVDPVVAAEAGGSLASDDAVRSLLDHLAPVADVLTPNLREASVLTGKTVDTVEAAEEAASSLLDAGTSAVVVTGGHLPGGAVDVVATRSGVERLEGKRLPGRFHGTGCTFSAAVTAFLADGEAVVEAASLAKDFTAEAMRGASGEGSGPSPVEPLTRLRRRS